MRRIFCIAIALFILTGLQACNNSRKSKNYNDKTPVDEAGASFIKDAVESSIAEVKLSKLAERSSQNKEVLDLAKMMVKDHQELSAVLKKIADNKKINTSDSINYNHENLMKSLSAKKGEVFDKEYIQIMVNDHEQAIKIYKDASANSDADIKKVAANTLPKLEEHLKKADALCGQLK
jgi:putative membrane protein